MLLTTWAWWHNYAQLLKNPEASPRISNYFFHKSWRKPDWNSDRYLASTYNVPTKFRDTKQAPHASCVHNYYQLYTFHTAACTGGSRDEPLTIRNCSRSVPFLLAFSMLYTLRFFPAIFVQTLLCLARRSALNFRPHTLQGTRTTFSYSLSVNWK